VDGAAKRLGVSTTTVYRLAAGRQLAFYRVARTLRFAAADIDAYLASCREETRKDPSLWA
jgi:excisionase family DNA binding protein